MFRSGICCSVVAHFRSAVAVNVRADELQRQLDEAQSLAREASQAGEEKIQSISMVAGEETVRSLAHLDGDELQRVRDEYWAYLQKRGRVLNMVGKEAKARRVAFGQVPRVAVGQGLKKFHNGKCKPVNLPHLSDSIFRLVDEFLPTSLDDERHKAKAKRERRADLRRWSNFRHKSFTTLQKLVGEDIVLFGDDLDEADAGKPARILSLRPLSVPTRILSLRPLSVRDISTYQWELKTASGKKLLVDHDYMCAMAHERMCQITTYGQKTRKDIEGEPTNTGVQDDQVKTIKWIDEDNV